MSPFPYFKTAFMTSIGNHWRSRHQKNNKKNRMPQLLIKSWYNCLITIHGLQTIRRKRLKYFSDLRHKWGFSCLFHSFFFPANIDKYYFTILTLLKITPILEYNTAISLWSWNSSFNKKWFECHQHSNCFNHVQDEENHIVTYIST